MQVLRVLRDRKGVKQQDVAEYLGVDRSTYAKYESGASEPNIDMLNKLTEYYHVSLDYLITGKEKETPLVNGDPELTVYLEELRTRPEMRMLFDVTKDATLEDVQTAVKIIEALRGKPDVDT